MSVFPVLAASSSSSFWYSPVSTRWAVGSDRSRAVLPSVFLMEQSATFCSKTGKRGVGVTISASRGCLIPAYNPSQTIYCMPPITHLSYSTQSHTSSFLRAALCLMCRYFPSRGSGDVSNQDLFHRTVNGIKLCNLSGHKNVSCHACPVVIGCHHSHAHWLATILLPLQVAGI